MVRRVDQAVPNRIAATSTSASGCAQDTCGGRPVPRSAMPWKTQPATRPTAAHAQSDAALIGRRRPSGSGGSGASSGGSGSALTVSSLWPHRRHLMTRESLHLEDEVLTLLQAAAVA